MRRLLGVVFGLALAASAGAQNHTRSMTNATSRMDGGPILSSGGVTGGTCTNQVVTALDTAGLPTCASISAAMIPNATITLANFANAVANSKLLGSGAAGAGASYSEITLGSGLTMTGTTLSSTGGGVADPGGNGIMARTALNTSINRTIVCAAAYCSWANGDGVAGAPSLTLSLTTTNDGGAVVSQGSSPGTAQTGNYNLSGIGIMDRDALVTTTTEALSLRNNTASTGGATRQVSPSLNFYGHAWNTATDDTDISRLWVDVGSAAATTMTWKWDTNIAGGGYVNAMSLTNAGVLTTVSTINAGGALSLSGTTQITFTSRSVLKSPSDGVFTLFNNGSTDFTRLNFGGTTSSFPALSKESASQLSSKLADNSGYAGVVADNYWIQTGSGGVRKQVQTTDPTTVLATGATTTATAGNLVTAPCKLIAVIGRITTGITTAANFTVKVTGGNVLNQIGTATTSNGTLTIGTTYTWVPAAFADQYYTSASTLTVTTNVNPGAGAIHFTVFCETFVPPTS